MCSAKAATSALGLVPKQISTGDRTIIEQHNGLARIKSGLAAMRESRPANARSGS
jgi:hypothetical protein